MLNTEFQPTCSLSMSEVPWTVGVQLYEHSLVSELTMQVCAYHHGACAHHHQTRPGIGSILMQLNSLYNGMLYVK